MVGAARRSLQKNAQRRIRVFPLQARALGLACQVRESLIGNGWHAAESGAACDEVAPACHPGDEEDLNHQNEWLAGRFRCELADSGASWRFERYVTRWCCTLLLYISRRSGYDAEASGLRPRMTWRTRCCDLHKQHGFGILTAQSRSPTDARCHLGNESPSLRCLEYL